MLFPVLNRCFVGLAMNFLVILFNKHPEALLQFLYREHGFDMRVPLDNVGADIAWLRRPETCIQGAEKAFNQTFFLWPMAVALVKLNLEFLGELFNMM